MLEYNFGVNECEYDLDRVMVQVLYRRAKQQLTPKFRTWKDNKVGLPPTLLLGGDNGAGPGSNTQLKEYVGRVPAFHACMYDRHA